MREQIIDAGKSILRARELNPERSLADHYNPLTMDPQLVTAHNALDRHVDRAFGATKTLNSNEDHQTVLIKRYQEMTERN